MATTVPACSAVIFTFDSLSDVTGVAAKEAVLHLEGKGSHTQN